MARVCVVCGGPPTSGRHSYCDACRPTAARGRERRRNRLRSRPSPADRGYGGEHKKLRARIARTVAAGEAICWRCAKPIDPDEPWDLGHDDVDRSVYRGPEHRACNRATAGRRASAAPVVRHSRDWW